MADTYASVVTLPAPPDQVLQAFLTSLAASGAFVTLSSPNSIVVTRRYTPPWAIVVGIIGIFFFLIGILAFLIKESEVLTLVLSPELEGKHTRVAVSGVATAHIAAYMNHVIVHYQAQAKAPGA